MAAYSDNFNRADSLDVGPDWSGAASWSIASNQLATQTSGGTQAIRYATALATDNNYAQVTCSVGTANSMGVFARGALDNGKYYLLRSNGTSWDLFRQVGGTFTNIGSYAATFVNGDVARIECDGSTIKALINGVERISVTDTGIATGLYGGLRSNASTTNRYDDFSLGDITAVAPPPAEVVWPPTAGIPSLRGVSAGVLRHDLFTAGIPKQPR